MGGNRRRWEGNSKKGREDYQLNLTHLHFVRLLGMAPFELCQDLKALENYIVSALPTLSYVIIFVILHLAVLIELQIVTDRRVDTQLQHILR